MQGDVVRAAKWLSGALVLSSVILVVGMHLVLSSHSASLGSALTRAAEQQRPPVVNVHPTQDGRPLRGGETITVQFDSKSALLLGGIPNENFPLKVEVQDKAKR
jgi:hypothetical protein